QVERHHLSQPWHGELWRNSREGLLVDRDSRRLLPYPHARPRPGKGELLHRREEPRVAGSQAEVGVHGSATRQGDGELRHLRQRHLPRKLAVVGRRASCVRAASADGKEREGQPTEQQYDQFRPGIAHSSNYRTRNGSVETITKPTSRKGAKAQRNTMA